MAHLCHALFRFSTRDVYPTSTGGKWVALCAMMVGVLVIAFPVSVFSDLWAREIEASRAVLSSEGEDEDDDADEGSHPGETPGSGNDTKKKHQGSTYSETGAFSNRAVKHHRSAHSDSIVFPNRAVDVDTLWSSIGVQSFLHNNQADVAASDDGGKQKTVTTDSLTTSNDTMIERAASVGDTAPGVVLMQPEDLQDILAHLESIRDYETRIRRILSRYNQ
jgi:hypothetical protein